MPRTGKYRCGQRVRITIEGQTGEGYIRSAHVRFWHTDDLRSFRYNVRCDKKLFGEREWQVAEDKVEVIE